jgi:hypothetical protein
VGRSSSGHQIPDKQPTLRRFDVFISHGQEDKAWAEQLATSLRVNGLRVFLDAWSIGPGEVSSLRRGEGIDGAANGIDL